MYRRAVVEKFAISGRKPIWVCGRTRQGDSASLKTSLTLEGSINGMSSPKAIIRNESMGAGGITRLSPTVEGSGMGALLNVSGTT